MLVDGELLLTVDVLGRPASYSTASTVPWQNAVRTAVAATGLGPWSGRFGVRIEIRTPQPRTANEVWGLDNLLKATLDAMERIFGLREWRRRAQAADDRVDSLEASKRSIRAGEDAGALIEVRRLIT